MRRLLILASVLAVSTAVLGACDPKANTLPNKPVATPVPVVTAIPVASPVVSPSVDPKASPVKPVTSPAVKKVEGTNVNKDLKPMPPVTKESPKTK